MTERRDDRHIESAIEVEATPAEVWEALTTAEGLARWFPRAARVRPGEGGEIWFSWGPDVLEAGARIVAWEPPRRLVLEWEGLRDEYLVEDRGSDVVVRVVSSGFGHGDDWDEIYDSVRTGWQFELRGLAHALERHRGMPRTVVSAWRPTELEAPAAFRRVMPEALETAATGTPFRLDLAAGEPLAGTVAVNNAPRDFAGIVHDLADAYFRCLVEPRHWASDRACRVTLWLSTYGLARDTCENLARSLEQTLDERIGRAAPAPRRGRSA
jgi:uncharacterized protein YndB with AHSA1/START domain